MKRYVKSSQILTEKEVIEIFGKSIWDMTTEEIINNGLSDTWHYLVDEEQ